MSDQSPLALQSTAARRTSPAGMRRNWSTRRRPMQSAPITAAELKAGAAERARQRPLLQKILSVFQKEKGSFRELIINSEPLEKRVALLVDGRLEKFEIERESDNRMVGGIYKGRIKNLDAGLKAAFVDIGYTKNAFLHYWDMLPAAADSSVEVVRVNKRKNAPPRPADPTVKDIPNLYPPGTDIVIQVTKGPIGTKGPRTTTNLSIPGPLPDPDAVLRRLRHFPQDRGAERAQAAQAADQRAHDSRGHGRHRAHRRRGQEGPVLRPRPAHSPEDLAGNHDQAAERARPGLPLPGARPRRAHRARLPHRGGRPRADRRQGGLHAHAEPGRADLEALLKQDRDSTRTASRSSSGSTSSARSSRPASARCRCRPAARS